MNVMILKVEGRKAIAVNETGEFIQIEAKKGMRPGAEFVMEKSPAPRSFIRPVLAAAAVFLVFLFGTAAWALLSISGYVDININPGVRLSFNPMGYVVKAEAINSDGTVLLSHMQNQPFTSVKNEVTQIIRQAQTDGYLKVSKDVRITISDDNLDRAESYEQELMAASYKAVSDDQIPVGIKTQKISLKAYKALCSELTGADDENKQKLYENGKWRSADNRVYIEKAEAIDTNTIRLVFSNTVSEDTGITVLLKDANGNAIDFEIIGKQGNTWIIKSGGLQYGCIYQLTVKGLKVAPKLNASFLCNVKENIQPDINDNPGSQGNSSGKNGTGELKGKDNQNGNSNKTTQPGTKNTKKSDNATKTKKVKPSKDNSKKNSGIQNNNDNNGKSDKGSQDGKDSKGTDSKDGKDNKDNQDGKDNKGGKDNKDNNENKGNKGLKG